MPSWPAESIITVTASAISVVTPRMAEINVRVWSSSPIRIVLDSAATLSALFNLKIYWMLSTGRWHELKVRNLIWGAI